MPGTRLGSGGLRKEARPLRELVTTKKVFGKDARGQDKTFDLSGLAGSKALAEQAAKLWVERGFEARIFRLPKPIRGQGKNAGKVATYAVYAR